MNRLFFLILFFFVKAHCGFSQLNCRGVLLDSATKKAIEFANIGVIGKGIGTVSNEKGEFVFLVPDSLRSGTVKISMIGYKAKSIAAANLVNNKTILLSPTSFNLNEVVVVPKKNKIKVLGNETRTAKVSGGFKSNSLGAELAVKLNIKHQNTQLRKFMLNIIGNVLTENPIFRLNVYTVSEDGMPKDNLLKQNILIEPKEKQGLIEFDLKPYTIFVDEDVFVSIEWIKDLGDASGLFFSTKLLGGSTYYRQTSQAKWEKVPQIGIGIHVEVGY